MNSKKELGPEVAIVMGSDSDWSTAQKTVEVLEQFGVSYEVRVISAHRSPDQAREYARNAHRRGVKVIIAVAGYAAHLAGVIASHTTLPVIGVPISAGSLAGIDALLSMVQMPSGVPVATVAIGGATNAGILAIQMLAVSNPELTKKINQYKAQLVEKVVKTDKKLKVELSSKHNKSK